MHPTSLSARRVPVKCVMDRSPDRVRGAAGGEGTDSRSTARPGRDGATSSRWAAHRARRPPLVRHRDGAWPGRPGRPGVGARTRSRWDLGPIATRCFVATETHREHRRGQGASGCCCWPAPSYAPQGFLADDGGELSARVVRAGPSLDLPDPARPRWRRPRFLGSTGPRCGGAAASRTRASARLPAPVVWARSSCGTAGRRGRPPQRDADLASTLPIDRSGARIEEVGPHRHPGPTRTGPRTVRGPVIRSAR